MPKALELSANQLREKMASGQLSSVDDVKGIFARIEKYEPLVGAYISVFREEAVSRAEEIDKKVSSGQKLGKLAGIPVAVKDNMCMRGGETTCGSKILENFQAPYDAHVIERLIAEDAVIIGKVNMDEFAMGSSTENSGLKKTVNPWDAGRVPGGSSGGSAAAVAAGMAPIALGTDTGGSIRQPAAFCGITGLKPTYGRVSRYGLFAYGSSLDSVGVIGQSAEDVTMVYQVMMGPDPRDSTSVDIPRSPVDLESRSSLEGLRVGVPKEYFMEGIQPEIESAIQEALRTFEGLDADVCEVSLPHTEFAVPVYYLIAPAEASANLARFDGVRYGPRVPAEDMWDVFRKTRGELFGGEVKRRIMLGTYALSSGYYDAYYGKAQKVRRLIRQDFDRAFEQVDLIAAPVAPTTAFKIGVHRDDPLSMYLEDIFTIPANLAGVPGLALPVGFDHHGLPVGMQLMAPHFQEEVLLQVVHVYQCITGWHQQKPGLSENSN